MSNFPVAIDKQNILKREHVFSVHPVGLASSDCSEGLSPTLLGINAVTPGTSSPLIADGGVLGPAVARCQTVMFVLEGASGASQGQMAVTTSVDHGNFGNGAVVRSVAEVSKGALSSITTEAMSKGIKTHFVGIDRTQSDEIATHFAGLSDATHGRYTALWVRGFALMEALAHGSPIAACAANPSRCWPDAAGTWPSYLQHLLPAVRAISDVNNPVVLLDASAASGPILPTTLRVFWQMCQPYCGVNGRFGPQTPGVAGRIPGDIELFLYGTVNKPSALPANYEEIGRAHV